MASGDGDGGRSGPKPFSFADLVPERFRAGVKKALAETDRVREKAEVKRGAVVRQRDAPGDVREALELIDRARKRPPKPAKTPSLAERIAAGRRNRDRIEQRSSEQRERFKQELRAAGHPDPDPPEIPRSLHAKSQPMLRDASGRATWKWVLSLPPVIRARVVKAALEPEPYTPQRPQRGRTLRTPHKTILHGPRRYWERPGRRRWNHPAAIKTVVAFMVLWEMSISCKRKGFARVTRGMGRGLVCSILRYAGSEEHASLSSCYGNMDGVPGYVRELARAGLFFSQQPPAGRLPARDVGPTGYAYNIYWWFPWHVRLLPKNATDADVAAVTALCATPASVYGPAPPS